MADILQTILPLILRHALDKRDRQRRAKIEEQQLQNLQAQQAMLAKRLEFESNPAVVTGALLEEGAKAFKATEEPKRAAEEAALHAAQLAHTNELTRSLKIQNDFAEQAGKKMGTEGTEGTGKGAGSDKAEVAHQAALSRVTDGISPAARKLIDKMQRATDADSLMSTVKGSDPYLLDEIENAVGLNIAKAENVKQPDIMAKGGYRPVQQDQGMRDQMRVIADNLISITQTARTLGSQEKAQSMAQQEQIKTSTPGTLELGLGDIAPGSPAQLTELLGSILTSGKTPEGRKKLNTGALQEPDRGVVGSILGIPAKGEVPTEDLPTLHKNVADLQTQSEDVSSWFRQFAPTRSTGALFGALPDIAWRTLGGNPDSFPAKDRYMQRAAAEMVARNAGIPPGSVGGKQLAPSLQGLQALPMTPEDLARMGEAWPMLSNESKNQLSAIIFNAQWLDDDKKKRAAEMIQRTLGLVQPPVFAGQSGFDALKQTLLQR